jgi:hypothetical protein
MHVPRVLGLVGALTTVVVLVPRALADAPPGRYDFTLDTVTDHQTGLVWQRKPSGPLTKLEDATAYCVSPWRVPEIKELATLVDEDATTLPFIDQKAFPGTPNVPVWSATFTNTEPEDYRCHILMPDGTTQTTYYNGTLFPGGAGGIVRCVK